MVQRGTGGSNRYLVLKHLPNDVGRTRLGFTVGKRLGKPVARNRVRRRLREAVRGLALVDGRDIVFVARSQAMEADFRSVATAARDLLKRFNLLAPSEGPK